MSIQREEAKERRLMRWAAAEIGIYVVACVLVQVAFIFMVRRGYSFPVKTPYLFFGGGVFVAIHAAWRRWRAYPVREGGLRCDACGYDLRRSEDRCPECGSCGTGELRISSNRSQIFGGIVSDVSAILMIALRAAGVAMLLS